MTKDQERATLAKIADLISQAGPDSYIATAFAGCVEDARNNIDWDAAFSAKEHAASLEKDVISLKHQVANLKEGIENRDILLHEKDQKWTQAKESLSRWQDEAEALKAEIVTLKESLSRWQDEAEALKAEIVTLKAKLYDLMTASP